MGSFFYYVWGDRNRFTDIFGLDVIHWVDSVREWNTYEIGAKGNEVTFNINAGETEDDPNKETFTNTAYDDGYLVIYAPGGGSIKNLVITDGDGVD